MWGGGVNIYCVEREEWYIGTVCVEGGKYILCGEGGMVHRYCVCVGGVNIYCVEREEWYIGTVCVWGG